MTRTKKLLISTGMAVTVIAGGAAIAVAQQAPRPPDLGPADLERATAAGRDAAGGGEVSRVEQDDDGTYDVEVRRTDGTETDVALGPGFDVLRVEDEGREPDDDPPVDDATRTRVGDAALAAVGDGTVTSVEADDGGYSVEIRHGDGTETEVSLDADLKLVGTERENDD